MGNPKEQQQQETRQEDELALDAETVDDLGVSDADADQVRGGESTTGNCCDMSRARF